MENIQFVEHVIVAAVIFYCAIKFVLKMYFAIKGKEIVIAKVKGHTPFKIESRDETSMTISTVWDLVNEGKQSALIVDCIVKPQLPFEHYDGIAVRGKAEVAGISRDDDYFEAMVLFAKGDPHGSNVIKMVSKVTFTARKGLSLNDALSHMVDFPIEIIYREVGRTPMHFSIARIILTAEELTNLAGVKLIKD